MRNILIRQLGKSLDNLNNLQIPRVPEKGWLCAIRKALGITSKQLGSRLGISQQAAQDVERREVEGSVTLNSLSESVRAMNCRLVYYIVPNEPLEQMIDKQIDKKARESLSYVSNLMELEDQKVDKEEQQYQLEDIKQAMRFSKLSRIWDE